VPLASVWEYGTNNNNKQHYPAIPSGERKHISLPVVLKPSWCGGLPGEQRGRVPHGSHGGGEPGARRPHRGGPAGGPRAGDPQVLHRCSPAARHLLQRQRHPAPR